MITKMTGVLTRVLDDGIRLQIGPFEYEILVPDAVRRQVQMRLGQEVTFHISEYFEGNSGGNRFVPRKLGFNTEVELEFFELFCTVDKIGAKKALKAMARPVKEIADAVARQDARWLSTLPGIGATMAEVIVTSLKRKITKFAMMSAPTTPAVDVATPDAVVDEKTNGKKTGGKKKAVEPTPEPAPTNGELIEKVYLALMGLGHNPIEARAKLDDLLTCGKPFTNFDEAITLIYAQKG